MFFFKIALINILLFMPLTGSAESMKHDDFEQKENTHQYVPESQSGEFATIKTNIVPAVNLLSSGDIFAIDKDSNDHFNASFLSIKPARKDELAERIQYILKSVKASQSIVALAQSRLPRHPQLKKPQFRIRLTDDKGDVYQFVYNSFIQSNLYILDYMFISESRI
ncbi:hypothetical protein MNBD_GAMMA11-1085 [hydrothermal vent metagenome]|uniref:Uncharacterized protein n=1 Tax=hydrothermal vent metagenome TaxID=652676 RepID=A0A3B0X396_9ZZZZ